MDESRILKPLNTILAMCGDGKSRKGVVLKIVRDGKLVDSIPWDCVGGTDVLLLFEDGTWQYGEHVTPFKS